MTAPHKTITGLFNQPLYYFESIDSTLNRAASLIKTEQTATTGMAIIADQQTKGRGQQGKTWADAPKSSLLLSVLFNKNKIEHSFTAINSTDIMYCVANSVCKTIQHHLKQKALVQIKWPNDILIDNCKVSGILVETYNGWIVIGLGVNLLYAPILQSFSTIKTIEKTNMPMAALDTFGINLTPIEFYSTLKKFFETELLIPTKERFDFTNSLLWGKNSTRTFFSNGITEQVIIKKILQDGGLFVLDTKQQETVKYSGQIMPIVEKNKKN